MMNILLDTLSGDAPPREIIQGAVDALESNREKVFNITLLGEKRENKGIFEDLGGDSSRIEYVDAPQRVSMSDSPVTAVRKNPNSSLVVGCERLKKDNSVFITPGNTGAVVAAALLKLGRISGIARPGLAALIPTLSDGQVVLIDVGATTDSSPKNLSQFAVMGELFAQLALDIPDVRVGLLNIGEEESKGNRLTKNSSKQLSKLDLNYIGNVEPHDILTNSPAEVVVCDGFSGNVLLKAFEGGASGTIGFFRKAVNSSIRAKLGGFLLRPMLNDLKEQLSFSRFGAVPLLGVRGTVFVGHGRSKSKAIKNAILHAKEAANWNLPEKIETAVERMDINAENK